MVKHGNVVKKTILYLLLILVCCAYVSPTFWIIITSFKTDKEAYVLPPKIFFKPNLVNYKLFFSSGGMGPNFRNSVVVAISSSLLVLILGTPAAYALSRFRFRKKEDLYFWFLSTRMAPPILAALPFFIMSRKLRVYDTRGLLILMYVLMNLAWVVWMMRSFFDEIPSEIDDACMVDGCNRFTALIRVILPLARPGLIATAIFCVILSWNEYFFALVLTSVKANTLPASLNTYLTVHGLMWAQMCAASTIIALPILIFVALLQKQLVRGLTMGAVKG